MRSSLVLLIALLVVTPFGASGCSKASPTAPDTTDTTTTPIVTTPATQQPVYVVLFTHIEDSTPSGTIPSGASRTQYSRLRDALVEMAALAKSFNMKWVLQPDWKYLVAALEYEDASMMSSTGGMNVFRYLRDVMGVAIDPHSHENGGYNYTDVAYLLEQLGVGGSTVIGGHIWDPSYPQFQQWDRFRSAVAGQRYPQYMWRGDILMGSGTPNHVADPILSGVWHPKDRNNYFDDDPSGNMVAVGAFKGDVAGLTELGALSKAGTIAAGCMMTATIHISPSTLTAAGGVSSVSTNIVAPVAALGSQVVSTDFTSLVGRWRSQYAGKGCTYIQSTR